MPEQSSSMPAPGGYWWLEEMGIAPSHTHHSDACLLVVAHASIHCPDNEDVFRFGLPVQQRCCCDFSCSHRR